MGNRTVWQAENTPRVLSLGLTLCALGAGCWWSVLTANRGVQRWEGECPAGMADLKEFRPGTAAAVTVPFQWKSGPNRNFQQFLPCALSILLFSGSLEGLRGTSAGHFNMGKPDRILSGFS